MDGDSKALQLYTPPSNVIVEHAFATTRNPHILPTTTYNISSAAPMDILCDVVHNEPELHHSFAFNPSLFNATCSSSSSSPPPPAPAASARAPPCSFFDILYSCTSDHNIPQYYPPQYPSLKALDELNPHQQHENVDDQLDHHVIGNLIFNPGAVSDQARSPAGAELRHFKLPSLLEQNDHQAMATTNYASIHDYSARQHEVGATIRGRETQPSARRNLEIVMRCKQGAKEAQKPDSRSGGRAHASKRDHYGGCASAKAESPDGAKEVHVDGGDLHPFKRLRAHEAITTTEAMACHAKYIKSEAAAAAAAAAAGSQGPPRMTHIAVERNRRKQMNEHLAILRSLMPTSYVQRGDQASIIGGVIEFVKELQQLLASLEAQARRRTFALECLSPRVALSGSPVISPRPLGLSPRPGHTPLSSPRGALPTAIDDLAATSRSSLADVEVKLAGGANVALRTLSLKAVPGQLVHLVAALESLCLEIVHLNITTLHQTVLYTFTLKIGIECRFSVDDLAGAVQEIFKEIHSSRLLMNE